MLDGSYVQGIVRRSDTVAPVLNTSSDSQADALSYRAVKRRGRPRT